MACGNSWESTGWESATQKIVGWYFFKLTISDSMCHPFFKIYLADVYFSWYISFQKGTWLNKMLYQKAFYPPLIHSSHFQLVWYSKMRLIFSKSSEDYLHPFQYIYFNAFSILIYYGMRFESFLPKLLIS